MKQEQAPLKEIFRRNMNANILNLQGYIVLQGGQKLI